MNKNDFCVGVHLGLAGCHFGIKAVRDTADTARPTKTVSVGADTLEDTPLRICVLPPTPKFPAFALAPSMQSRTVLCEECILHLRLVSFGFETKEPLKCQAAFRVTSFIQ